MNGLACTNSILGNRLTKGSNTYGWDALNRMTSLGSSSYSYRADGMRTRKTVGSATTTYRYDGQMGIQDVEVAGSTTTVTDYALGARGVDAISTKVGANPATVSYPLYDAHGNMISTLSKSGSGYTYSALRSFDAWGVIRTGATTGDPKGRYCASIGHKQDDESGLIYMRARYYEPSSGRFVSEDKARNGINWLSYCRNNPVGLSDRTGNAEGEEGWNQLIAIALVGGAFITVFTAALLVSMAATPADLVEAIAAAKIAAFVTALATVWVSGIGPRAGTALLAAEFFAINKWIDASAAATAVAGKTLAGKAAVALFAYDLVLAGYLAYDLFDNGVPGQE